MHAERYLLAMHPDKAQFASSCGQQLQLLPAKMLTRGAASPAVQQVSKSNNYVD
jgi:hypothetical protein